MANLLFQMKCRPRPSEKIPTLPPTPPRISPPLPYLLLPFNCNGKITPITNPRSTSNERKVREAGVKSRPWEQIYPASGTRGSLPKPGIDIVFAREMRMAAPPILMRFLQQPLASPRLPRPQHLRLSRPPRYRLRRFSCAGRTQSKSRLIALNVEVVLEAGSK